MAVELRKGPKVDLTKSRVPDPKSIPVDSASRKLPQTMWRVDRLRDMTYTQFWHLIQERQIARVSVCPGGLASGYTYFIPQEEHLESQVVTRGYLEGRMVVGLAGRWQALENKCHPGL
ncbi:hypothetical protein WJX79_000645 [Trebouxia sp. C0005]